MDAELSRRKTPTPPVTPLWATETGDHPHARQTVEVDLKELAQALEGKPDADALLKRYREVRRLLWTLTVEVANGSGGAQTPKLAPPQGIPGEFADYLEGAIAQARGDTADACQAWERLLRRPPAERRFRSTWAAYMLGVCHHGSDRGKAVRWYQETRALAAQGFRDGLGLGAASLGREAQVELRHQRFDRAAQLYLEASALKDPYGPSSLRELCWELLRADRGVQRQAMKQPVVREVLGIYLTATEPGPLTPGSSEERIHTMLLAETRDEKDMPGADRLAWFAYQRGEFQAAEEWLRRAPEGSPVGAWIRSKLLARRGKLQDAAEALTRAVAAFPLDPSKPPAEALDDLSSFEPSRRLRGELGVLKLARGQFLEAHDLLLRAGYWRDAAHVAERVLSLDELRTHVDRSWPEPASSPPAQPGADPEEIPALGVGGQLRYLLARRLARAGRWKEARGYFPAQLHGRVDAYLAGTAASRDGKKSAEERAEALWVVAKIEREKGMELLGTELGPDWFVDGGQFDEDQQIGAAVAREKLGLRSGAEERRVKQSAPAYPGRFHYRYLAAQHALESTRLLPAKDPRISERLCAAFGWLKNRDEKAAQVYAREARRRGEGCR
jgi:tetratricopeptide (TPR) repeat protein